MARRSLTEEIEQEAAQAPPEDGEAERSARRKPKPQKKDKGAGSIFSGRKIRWSYVLLPVVALAGSFALTAAFHLMESFLLNDSHFVLQAAADYGVDPPCFQIDGLRRASKAEILRVLEQDLGRSLYLFDAAERRRNLLALEWVREASVSRRWPNRVYVRIIERTPVAFVQINRPKSPPLYYLTDPEGVLLPIPKGERFDNLVVLTGLTGREPEGSRGIRVRQALQLLTQAGPLSAYISEIDVRDPGNLQATLKVDAGAVAVRMGGKDFGPRLRRFMKHYPDIQKRRPEARTFDLRMDDRIIAVDEEAHGG